MADELKKRIVITGATRGCGRSLVDRFVELGHVVIGCGRSEEQINRLRSQYPSPHRFDVVDVSLDDQVAAWTNDVVGSVGIPDILINNAALMNHPAPLWNISAAEFQQLVNVNIVGTANVVRHFVPAMIQRGLGIIVNFSSGWGRSTAPEVAPYCATKFAVEGLTKSFAQELPAGMVTVALNPGIINTEMLQSCWEKGAEAYPSPDEWSRVAAPFLLRIGPQENGRSLTITM